MKTTRTIAVLVLVGMLALSGCTGTDPGSSTAATDNPTAKAPTTTAPTDPMHTSPAEAVAMYRHYIDVWNAEAQAGFPTWQTTYLPLLGGDERAIDVLDIPDLIAGGWRLAGKTTVVGEPEVVSYTDASVSQGAFYAVLDVCLNSTGNRWTNSSGESLPVAVDGQYFALVRMERLITFGPEGEPLRADWRVVGLERDASRPC